MDAHGVLADEHQRRDIRIGPAPAEEADAGQLRRGEGQQRVAVALRDAGRLDDMFAERYRLAFVRQRVGLAQQLGDRGEAFVLAHGVPKPFRSASSSSERLAMSRMIAVT
jgi:hypothetical protein